ncbi:lysozyme inhibitor LprI family protein [Intestinibacter bartlettii]|uniref:lysozyme inhibitor LprI family protein n=1 Tax=Intestinibacter bartlettii TaxID=261299 RepID=UPI00248AFBD0|nr:lysozyme inhibitor LprI family protein [Intestinibacter bartlettii]
MKKSEGEALELWDDALNEIYGVLKTQLSTSEMDALRTKQRAWIKYRNNTAESEAAEFGNGTMADLAYVSTTASLTKERCYELVNIYMK